MIKVRAGLVGDYVVQWLARPALLKKYLHDVIDSGVVMAERIRYLINSLFVHHIKIYNINSLLVSKNWCFLATFKF